jgi:hypothetical protein
MSFRRLCLLLVAIGWFAPWSRGQQPVHAGSKSTSPQAFADFNRPADVTLSSSRPHNVSPTSPRWYRIKSVLPDTDSRFAPESDLGPLPLPDHFVSSLAQTPNSGPSVPVVPLRC